MKYVYGLLIVIVSAPGLLIAQDEGEITKKARIDRANNVFINGGPSFPFGENIGDYGTGFNIELGYTRRVNRLLSIGPSFSYLKFKYSPEQSDVYAGNAYYGLGTVDTNWYGSYWDNWHDKYGFPVDYDFNYAYELTLTGGDLQLLSFAVNLKLNFVPVKDNSIVSVYLFLKPFVTQSTRKAVYGKGERFVYEAYEDFNGQNTAGNGVANSVDESDDWIYWEQEDDTWYPDGYTEDWGPDGFPALAEDKVITGGIFLGPGFEFLPAKRLSFFLQPLIGYTFPITFVSTKSYDNNIDSYLNDDFPIVKKGFTSLNVQIGISYNF